MFQTLRRSREFEGARAARDSLHATRIVEQMVRDMGYVPVNIGTLAESAPLDIGGVLWPRMLVPEQMRDLLQPMNAVSPQSRVARRFS